MPYLSLAAVLGEMRRAEADAQSAIDLSFLPEEASPEKKDPPLDPGAAKTKPGGTVGSVLEVLGAVVGVKK
jgi:hypothetical protein